MNTLQLRVLIVACVAVATGCLSSHGDGHECTESSCDEGSYCSAEGRCVAAPVCAIDADCVSAWAGDPCRTNPRCDGATSVCVFDPLDRDGDGHSPRVCGGGDCDDIDVGVNPDQAEWCNGVDDDCNGSVDDGVTPACAIGGSGGTGGTGGVGGTGGTGGTGGGVCVPTAQVVDKVDLLFVVDNSGSMAEEQQSLRVQFPRLIRSLTRGERLGPNDTVVGTFPAVRDLHLGVVSVDMGLQGVPGRASLGCGDESRPRGDDGVLRNAPNPGGAAGLACAGSYPLFLQFALTQDPTANDVAATQLANDFSCIASLGTRGCGFEMQLESMLVALWPSDNVLTNGATGSFADRRPFLNGTPNGQGAPTGPNTGFLRNDASNGLSLIAIVVVSDEEDCSSHNMGHFVPPNFLADGDPLKPIGLNLRCFNESVRVGGDGPRDQGMANLYSTSRYAQGLKQLRPGNEDLVVFAGIVGVPPDLVTPERIDAIDFSNQAERSGFYDALLSDPRLIETPDPITLSANPNLIPSCLRDSVDPASGTVVSQKAFPPRRFIKVAREFGENSVIESICSDDFTPAINRIVDTISQRLGQPICR